MGYHLYCTHNYSCSSYWESSLWIVADYSHVPVHMALHHLVLLLRLLMETCQPQPLMMTCLPILHEVTLLTSLNNRLHTVMFILIVQCILMSLLNMSSTMDRDFQPIKLILIPMDMLPHHRVLMVIHRGDNLDMLLLLLMGMLMSHTINMDTNLLTHLHYNQSMIHLTNRCHLYSQQLLNLRWTQ